VFVSVVVERVVPVAAVLYFIVPPVIVKPVVTSDTVNEYHKPFAAVGSVQEGDPLEARLLNVCPHCAAVRITVAPTNALSVTVLNTPAPDGAARNTGAAVNVAAPVTTRVEPKTTALAVCKPSSLTGGR